MNQKLLFLATAFALLVMSSCKKDEEPVNEWLNVDATTLESTIDQPLNSIEPKLLEAGFVFLEKSNTNSTPPATRYTYIKGSTTEDGDFDYDKEGEIIEFTLNGEGNPTDVVINASYLRLFDNKIDRTLLENQLDAANKVSGYAMKGGIIRDGKNETSQQYSSFDAFKTDILKLYDSYRSFEVFNGDMDNYPAENGTLVQIIYDHGSNYPTSSSQNALSLWVGAE